MEAICQITHTIHTSSKLPEDFPSCPFVSFVDLPERPEQAQVLNDLKATGFKIGVLINFGSRGKLEWKRFVR